MLPLVKFPHMNVVITGASQGMGRAMAEAFAKEGHDLFLCARNMDKTAAWQHSLMKEQGISITSFNADLSKKEGVDSFAHQLLSATSRIDVLINNAGTYEPGSTYNEPEGALDRMLSINLHAAYHLTRALVGKMIEQKEGHIFNMCSIAALKAYANGGAYSISKWAMEGFSQNLREEMKAFNIKVTTIHPGATYTASWEGSGVNPGRLMEANDIAQMVVAASKLSPQACVEQIIIRPQLGDL